MTDSSTTADAQAVPVGPHPAGQEIALLDWIAKMRWGIFLILALVQVASFNGRWRIGRDGALYRAVAANLASGHGYTYRGQIERHVYPGLPLLLAGIEKVFGHQDALEPTATLVVMALIGAVTLVVIYLLMKLYLPLWLAVCIVTGVGINKAFLQQEQDVMTDVPFLLTSLCALLTLAHFARAKTVRNRVLLACLLPLPLVAALLIRPTFWALAGAMVGACVIGLIRSPRRWWYAAGLLTMAGAVLLWSKFDPRGGAHPLSGVYETKFLAIVGHLGSLDWEHRITLYCQDHFPVAMLGIELGRGPTGFVFTTLVLASGVLLVRRVPLWGLYVLVTVGMTLLMGSVPRYFLMILPFLLAGWGLAVYKLAQRATFWRWAPAWVMLLGLGLATVPNLVMTTGFVMEQHGIFRNFWRDRASKADRSGKLFLRKPFLETYRSGTMLPIYQMSQVIRAKVPAGVRVLSPESRIMTFLSGHDVYSVGELPASPQNWPRALRNIPKLRYCVSSSHMEGRVRLQQLVRRRLVDIQRRPIATVGEGGDRLRLSKMQVKDLGKNLVKNSKNPKTGRRPAPTPRAPVTRPAP